MLPQWPKNRPRTVRRQWRVLESSRLLSQLCVCHALGAAAAKLAKEEAQKKVEEGK
jgi:hypothetical protein